VILVTGAPTRSAVISSSSSSPPSNRSSVVALGILNSGVDPDLRT
jgi:hypothetical protein